MGFRERIALWLRPAVFLSHNRTTLAGAVLTTSSAVTLIGFWFHDLVRGEPVHPYTGIVFYLILPGVFVLGLLLMPLGVWWHRRGLRARGELPAAYPAIDLRSATLRRGVLLVGVLTGLNVIILGTATYRGVSHMNTVQFCGETCHTVMSPQLTAYLGSPHSRVDCVQCHIGPGAPWFVRSKLSGVRQIFAVTLNTYSRPIPAPVKELRPARETCEQCHWPQKFHGDKFLVRTKYADDEENTPLTTVLVLKIGGRTWQGSVGIHGRHLDTVERISYVSIDGRRQVISQVNYIDDEGKTVEYLSQEVQPTAEQLAKAERRQMDCMDCHNRPTHAFQMPERAVDEAITAGRISRQLPFVKKKSVELLRADYPDRGVAAARITAGLADYYRTSYPEVYRTHRPLVELAAEQVKAIYLRNVFPEMKVTWGTYPNNLGHADFLGCFRCHGGSHVSADGKMISPDCTSCHTILAMEDPNPKVLTDLGLQ
jgi:nitrate/TMAO reductase-like tetraheme cytochrome c subunit